MTEELSTDLKVRVDAALRRRVEAAARREGRSLSQWMRRAIVAALGRMARRKAKN